MLKMLTWRHHGEETSYTKNIINQKYYLIENTFLLY